MSTETSHPHAGLDLDSRQYAAEADAYFQNRLRIWYGVSAVAVTGFYVISVVQFLTDAVPGHSLLDPAPLVHLAAVLVVCVDYYLLSKKTFRYHALCVFDGMGLYIAIGTCLAMYALMYVHGPRTMPAILGVCLIARAVLVPSRALRTFLLSLPAPLGFLAIQLAYGTAYHAPDLPVAPDRFLSDLVVWDQVALWFALGIATVASYVNFSLRRQAQEARQLGQYQLDEKIGEGGMGEVYRATHAMLRRPTAIKLLRPEITGESTLKRFEREVRETSRLTHPNTVAVYDYGRTAEGVFYYAMEYLEGADLKEIVDGTGPMPAARAIHVLEQACGALTEAHALGLIHRDIKPGNIILSRRGGMHDVAKVVDFGLVKDLKDSDHSLTRLGDICGTPETLAPEVLSGGAASAGSDLYALGVVGYYLLTARPIFDAKTAAEFLGHHLHTDPIPPTQRDESVPPDLEAVILACLAKDPDARPGGAARVRERLLACDDAGGWTQEQAAEWWAGLGRGLLIS